MVEGGCSLQNSFNQDDADAQRSTHARDVPAAEALQTKRKVDLQKLQHTKLGTLVTYSKGQGTVVSKEGSYLTLFNEEANAYDKVHVGETYIPGDSVSFGIMNKLWDQMTMETRTSTLHKAKILNTTSFAHRTWYDLPSEIRDVLKSGFAGREEGETKEDEGRSFRDADPNNKKQFEKSDVEHGAYGGVVTDTPFDAPKDYEDDRKEVQGTEFQHNNQQKTPKDIKDDAEEVLVGYIKGANSCQHMNVSKEIKNGEPDDVEKEGGDAGGAGAISTSTEGANNPVYDKKKSSRYGVRYHVSQEEFDNEQRLKY